MSASHRTMNLFENPSYFRLTGRGDVKSVKNLTLLISPLLLLLLTPLTTLLLGALTSPLLGNCYGAN